MSTVAILNPKAGGGRTAQAWEKVRAHLVGPVEELETQARGHAIELTRNAIRAGARSRCRKWPISRRGNVGVSRRFNR